MQKEGRKEEVSKVEICILFVYLSTMYMYMYILYIHIYNVHVSMCMWLNSNILEVATFNELHVNDIPVGLSLLEVSSCLQS